MEFHLRQLLQNQGTLNANGIVVGADGPKRSAWRSGDTVQVIILAAARFGCSRHFTLSAKILLSDWNNASFAIKRTSENKGGTHRICSDFCSGYRTFLAHLRRSCL